MKLEKKYYLIAAIVTTMLVGGALAGKNFFIKPVEAERVPVVRTQTVALAEQGETYDYSGEVRGRYETQLGFRVGGKILSRNVELGSRVQAGEVLMTLDGDDLQQALRKNDAQVFSAKSQSEMARVNLKRYEQLYDQGAVSKAEYDRYKTEHDTAVGGLRQAAAQYNQGANQVDYSVLRADASGVIASLDAEIGQVVSQGQKVLTLVRDGEKEVEINVPENRVEEVRKAGTCRVSFWALPQLTLTGNVREIAPMADKASRTFRVRIALQNPPEELKLGMTANVSVAAGKGKSIRLPVAAVYQNQEEPQVWVVKNGAVELRSVKIGAFADEKVEIVSGLNDGDVVVTAGVHKLWPGQQVKTGGGGL